SNDASYAAAGHPGEVDAGRARRFADLHRCAKAPDAGCMAALRRWWSLGSGGIEYLTAAGVLLSVLAIGSVHVWALAISATIFALAGIAALLSGARVPAGARLYWALAGFSALQAIPLPRAL